MNDFDDNKTQDDEKGHDQLQPVHQKWSWPGNARIFWLTVFLKMKIGSNEYNEEEDGDIWDKGCPRPPNPQFFNIVQKGGGGVKPMFKNFGANFVWF